MASRKRSRHFPRLGGCPVVVVVDGPRTRGVPARGCRRTDTDVVVGLRPEMEKPGSRLTDAVRGTALDGPRRMGPAGQLDAGRSGDDAPDAGETRPDGRLDTGLWVTFLDRGSDLEKTQKPA
jgi:hypothetical protein